MKHIEQNKRIWSVLNWLRGSLPVRDGAGALVELFGFRLLAEQSQDVKVLWDAIIEDPNQDNHVKKAEEIFIDINWRMDHINRLLDQVRDRSLFKQAIHTVDQVNLAEDGYEIAWKLIDFINQDSSFKYDLISMPKELAGIASSILSTTDSVSTLCLGPTTIGVGIEVGKNKKLIKLELPSANYLAEILLKISGADVESEYRDLLEPPEVGKKEVFTHAVVSPPWGMRVNSNIQDRWRYAHFSVKPTSMESYYIQQALERVEQRVVAIVAPGFLFKTAGTDQELKSYLVQEGFIESIIQLPSKIIPSTGVPPVLIVLNKNIRNDSVIFIDASGYDLSDAQSNLVKKSESRDEIYRILQSRTDTDISRKVPREELAENDFNLSVKRYVLTAGEQHLQQTLAEERTMPLGDIVEITRAQAVKSEGEGILLQEGNPADITESGYLGEPGKNIYVNSKNNLMLSRQQLRPGDVLLAVKGSIGRTGVVPDTAGNNWYAGQSFVILRLRPDSPIKSPTVLYRYLASDLAQRQLLSRAAGTTVKLIKMQDISSLPVVIPTEKEQQEIIANNERIVSLYEEIAELNNRIESLKSKYWSVSNGHARDQK